MIAFDTPAGRALSTAHVAALSASSLIACARSRLKDALVDGNAGTLRALQDSLAALDVAACKAALVAQKITDAGIA